MKVEEKTEIPAARELERRTMPRCVVDEEAELLPVD
jgi:hypothetical protein